MFNMRERERERFYGMQLIDSTNFLGHFGDGLKEGIKDYLDNFQLWILNYFLKLLECNYLLASHVKQERSGCKTSISK